MPQRSSIRWLPLPPHTVLGAQVPSIAMATVGAVDGEGCLEWQPWQEPGPSNDPGGEGKETEKAKRKGESQEKVNANPVTCDYGREVQGRLHSNLSLSPRKGQHKSLETR